MTRRQSRYSPRVSRRMGAPRMGCGLIFVLALAAFLLLVVTS